MPAYGQTVTARVSGSPVRLSGDAGPAVRKKGFNTEYCEIRNLFPSPVSV